MTVVFGPLTLGSDGSGNSGESEREVCAGLTGGGGQVRVTAGLHSSADRMTIDHCSIGILGGATAPNMAATDGAGRTQPVEVTFGGGGHGFDLGTGGTTSGTTIASDIVAFTFAQTDTLIVVYDFHSSGGGNIGISSSGDGWDKVATASWNQATVSGFTDLGVTRGVSQIEGFPAAVFLPYTPVTQMGPIMAQRIMLGWRKFMKKKRGLWLPGKPEFVR